MDKKMLVNNLRDGIFSLHTRRFGTVAELVINEKYKFSDSTTSQHYDSTNSKGERVEIKFSRVLKENSDVINKENILQQSIESSTSERAISTEDIGKYDFDCNIQQIKRLEFDVLYYGLFFSDKIAIFTLKADDVESVPGYSDFQHKGNEGEGQFHVNSRSIQYHMENNFKEYITYEKVYDMFSKYEDK